jgi:hypothetical protein
MYNIHSHYENIFSYVKQIAAQPKLVYLYPFGTTSPENMEITDIGGYGPLLFCYDQEPIIPDFNQKLFEKAASLKDDLGNLRTVILLNTEKDSKNKNLMLEQFKFIDCYYFFHALAAVDWYRGYPYNLDLIPIEKRKINKKFISFNRITGGARSYRSILVSELQKREILNFGHISYSDKCPEYGHYKDTLFNDLKKYTIPEDESQKIISYLDQIEFPLRIDTSSSDFIPNNSFNIGPIPQLMESFVQLVTETCFYEKKLHLTEKIFKPIVAKQPFLLVSCQHNLKYFKSYGFKTFSNWWDESYDNIENPLKRLSAIIDILELICKMKNSELKDMLVDMQETLDYNYERFYSKEFIEEIWDELKNNLNHAVSQLPIPIEAKSQFHQNPNIHTHILHALYQFDKSI